MSSNKPNTLWQRLKKIFTLNQKKTVKKPSSYSDASSRSKTSNSSDALSSLVEIQKADSHSQVSQGRFFLNKQDDVSQPTPPPRQSSTQKTTSESVNFNPDTSSNLIHNQKQRKPFQQPITDAVLEFLETNNLSYHHHKPTSQHTRQRDDNFIADSLTNDTNQNTAQDSHSRRHNVHHISMAMKHYSEPTNNQSGHNFQLENEDDSHSSASIMEWGCVIRIHEHTQLLAMYGILPFHLPKSHLSAGLTLAAQINYDMMLGNVEIDIRDGEIRFKNALDLEPIIDTNEGSIPPKVINFLLKGVIAMTSSFSPLFSELVMSDAATFELENILEQLYKAQKEHTFYMVTDTIQ